MRIIGISMVILLFAGLLTISIRALGWREALIGWGFSFCVCAFVALTAFLIVMGG